MEARLVELAGLLRQRGLRVSTAELVDASAALGWVDLGRKEEVRAALESALVKRSRDRQPFREAFELFFSGVVGLLGEIEAGILARLQEEGALDEDTLRMLAWELQNRPLSPLTRAALEGDAAQVTSLLRGAALRLDLGQMSSTLQQGFYARRLGSAAGLGGVARELAELEADLRARGLDPKALEAIGQRLRAALEGLERSVRRLVEGEAEARLAGKPAGAPEEKPFALLSQQEIDDMEGTVRRLAERLKARMLRRQRLRRRGALNVRRTLRLNLSAGGYPARVAFRGRRPARPDVVVLCDVSDSVRTTSRLMLLFLHTLQSLFARVRSYVFVSEIGEITRELRELDVRRAVDPSVVGRVVSLTENSSYGRALSQFVRTELGAVTRRTTVMVIGDGRNNYNPANAWALRELKLKARRVVWICPEPRSSWGLGDSEMLTYERQVSQVAIVSCVADLEKLADSIVPS